MSYNTISKRPPSPRSRQTGWKRCFRYIYLRLLRQRGGSNRLARGFAVGVFAGCFPLLGLQTLLGVTLAIPLCGNKLMAVAGTWISNPLTYLPIFMFNFRVGQYLLNRIGIETDFSNLNELTTVLTTSNEQAFKDFLAFGGLISGTLFVGCLIVGLIAASISYVAVFHGINRIRDRSIAHRQSGFQQHLQKHCQKR